MASLTQAQKQALRADIDADPVLSAYPNTGAGAYEIAQIYNAEAKKVKAKLAAALGWWLGWRAARRSRRS